MANWYIFICVLLHIHESTVCHCRALIKINCLAKEIKSKVSRETLSALVRIINPKTRKTDNFDTLSCWVNISLGKFFRAEKGIRTGCRREVLARDRGLRLCLEARFFLTCYGVQLQVYLSFFIDSIHFVCHGRFHRPPQKMLRGIHNLSYIIVQMEFRNFPANDINRILMYFLSLTLRSRSLAPAFIFSAMCVVWNSIEVDLYENINTHHWRAGWKNR